MGHLTKYNPILLGIMAVSLPGASRPVRDSVVDDVQGAVCQCCVHVLHSVLIEFLVDLCLRQAFPRRKAAKIGKNEGCYVFTLFSGPAAQEGEAGTPI